MKLKLELESKDVNYILAVLSKQPFEQVHLLIAEIMRQAQAQPADGQVSGG